MKKMTFCFLLLGGMMLSSCGTMGTSTTDTTQSSTTSTSNGADLGSVLGSILGGTTSSTGSSTGSILGDIISTVTGGITTNQNTIVGTWNYSRPSVQFESDNLLAQAGGSVIAEKVKNQLVTYYQKVGIKAGACQFVFNKDNSMKYTINGKTYTGTYSFNSSKKTMTLNTQYGQNITAYVSIASGAMGLTFDVSNLLNLVKNAGGASSQLGTISTIASNYSGMKLGFEFSK